MFRLYILAVAVAVSCASAQATAQPAESYGGAMRWYEREAEAGSPSASFLLGLLYERGEGPRDRDPEQAFRWFLQAARLGHPQAQYKVGTAFQFGSGTAVDRDGALLWYRRAARQGIVEAAFNLAHMLENGDERSEASGWYAKAARQGYGPAQLNLGRLYARGEAAEKDLVEAWAWFRAAESRGVEGASDARSQLGTVLDAAQRARAEKLSEDRVLE